MVEACALVPFPANLAVCAALGAAIVLAQVFPGFIGASQLVETAARARPDETLALAAFLTMSAVAAASIGRLVSVNASLGRSLRMQERSVDTLAELNKNLQGYARTADEESAERERNRISREIHDISGYIFTNLIALMDAAGSLPPDDREALLDGVEATRSIMARWPAVRILMLSTYDEDRKVKEALSLGAAGYLLKDISPVELIASIRALSSGVMQISPQIVARLMQSSSGNGAGPDRGSSDKRPGGRSLDDGLDGLTSREREVLALIADGFDNAYIASELCIAEHTVRNHVSSIYAKLEVEDRFQIIQMAKAARFGA